MVVVCLYGIVKLNNGKRNRFRKRDMERIKVRIEKNFLFAKGSGCADCDLYDLCNDVDWSDCQGGMRGHYEIEEEEINQI